MISRTVKVQRFVITNPVKALHFVMYKIPVFAAIFGQYGDFFGQVLHFVHLIFILSVVINSHIIYNKDKAIVDCL